MKSAPKLGSIFLLILNSLLVQGLVCPPEQDIAPCHCFADLGNIQCHEWFGNVNQDLLNNVLSIVRQVNNVAGDQWLDVNLLHVGKTPMTSIDLTPFLGVRYQTLSISFSTDMSSFVVPQIGGGQLGIEATTLQILSNGLTDQSLAQLFESQLVTPNSLKNLFIGGNKIKGAQNGEFIPGLFLYKQLEKIDLRENSETLYIVGGQFKELGALREIDLASSSLDQIGPDAFLLNSNGDLQNEPLLIDLSENNLKDDNFNAANGLWYPNTRPAVVELKNNQFEFMSETNFRAYLYANEANRLEAEQNQWFCDQRMKWLKDDRAGLESRVNGVWCTNDPGQTIFTTNLV